MNQNSLPFSKKQAIIFSALIVFSLLALFFSQEMRFNDRKLHVVFCNVGQGDAIFIRTPKQNDVLIDGGPDRKVLDCLSQHMPFWDRTLELVILSHPHQDHFAGLIDVIQSYTIESFVTEKLDNKSSGFDEFGKALSNKKITPHYVISGDSVKTKDGVVMKLLTPSQAFLSQTSPSGLIGESEEFGSLVWYLSYGDFDLLLTSDAQVRLLTEGLATMSGDIEVMQVPHHGSKYALDKDLVDKINPKLAIISVGKNRFGHPSGEILKILGEKDITILRTDQNGTIEIVSDRKSFHLSN